MNAFIITILIALSVALFVAFKIHQNTRKLRKLVKKGDKVRFKYNGNTYNQYVELVGYKNNKKAVRVTFINKNTHRKQTITLPVSKVKLSR